MGEAAPALHRGADPARDQSYFLFATTREQLDFLRFPLGNMTKSEARALARALGLTVADKPDSQDICFVPNGRYAVGGAEAAARRRSSPATSFTCDGRVARPPRRHRALHRRPAPRLGAGRACGHRERAALCRAPGGRRRAASSSARARRSAAAGFALYDVNWLGRRSSTARCRSRSACAPRGRCGRRRSGSAR